MRHGRASGCLDRQAGLVGAFTDLRRGLVRRIGFLDGPTLCAGVALLALGVALFAAAESRGPG
ncbi:hypothetical protein ACI2LV_09290 [Streptomyces fungicidicus]|uniref:hypothetical protein n=1 Tax=Streptomyces fungicidicus TaxID=68203 RepID=UPI00384FABD5